MISGYLIKCQCTVNGEKGAKMNKYLLNGDWDLCYCNIGEYNYSEAARCLNSGSSFLCLVPGSVHSGLINAEVIEEPLIKMNAKACKFIEDKDFWYRKDFDINHDFIKDKTILCFDGVDLDADIYFNGSKIGHHENAFLKAEFDVTDRIISGKNTVIVRVNEGLAGVKSKTVDYMEYSWNQEERYRTWLRKPQFCYGWDWAVRLSTCGIFKSVYLNSFETAYIEDVYITDKIASDLKQAEFKIAPYVIKVGGQLNGLTLLYRVYSDDNFLQEDCIYEIKTKDLDLPQVISLENPKLWWPNGYGDQHLYGVELVLTDQSEKILDSRRIYRGLRQLSIVQTPLDNEGNKTFTFQLNGCKIFAKGANWVPVDQLAGRVTIEKYESLIKSAVDMNMNMFRVWGGGYYESDEFFNLCDKYGILVWHDFMFACGYYPEFDEEFIENVRREAEYQVKRLRNCTCFVGWSGNNENYSMFDSLQKNIDSNAVFYGKKIYEQVLPEICESLDHEREYRHSSPFGGDFPDSVKEGDQHLWAYNQIGNEKYMDLFAYTETRCKFLSEFGVLGPMNLESLKKCVDEDQLYPYSEQWLFHSNNGDYFDTMIERYFGIATASRYIAIERYILMGQAIQAECLRYIFQEYRARKFECSGVLLWMYSDCYPTSGWTFVDYYLNKKPLYYYTRRAFSPLGITFRGCQPNSNQFMNTYTSYYKNGPGTVEVVLTNDRLTKCNVKGEITVMTLDGEKLMEHSEQWALESNSVKTVSTMNLSDTVERYGVENLVLICSVTDKDEYVTENRFFLAPFEKLLLRKEQVVTGVFEKDNYLELKLKAASFVWMLHLNHQENVIYDDNDFDLFPSQEKTVKVYGISIADFKPQFLSLNPND